MVAILCKQPSNWYVDDCVLFNFLFDCREPRCCKHDSCESCKQLLEVNLALYYEYEPTVAKITSFHDVWYR